MELLSLTTKTTLVRTALPSWVPGPVPSVQETKRNMILYLFSRSSDYQGKLPQQPPQSNVMAAVIGVNTAIGSGERIQEMLKLKMEV